MGAGWPVNLDSVMGFTQRGMGGEEEEEEGEEGVWAPRPVNLTLACASHTRNLHGDGERIDE